MSAPLSKTLETIAAKFAQDIVQALRGASIDDLTGIAAGRLSLGRPAAVKSGAKRLVSGRLGRRSADDIQKTLGQIVTLLGGKPEGLRAEEIKQALGLDRREVPRPIAEGIHTGVLSKSGQKRATVYTVASASGPATSIPSKRPKKKAAAKN